MVFILPLKLIVVMFIIFMKVVISIINTKYCIYKLFTYMRGSTKIRESSGFAKTFLIIGQLEV